MVAFKVFPLGSYAPMPAPSPPFKTILELVLWNGFQSCRCITPDVISVIKMPSFQYFLYLREQKKITGALCFSPTDIYSICSMKADHLDILKWAGNVACSGDTRSALQSLMRNLKGMRFRHR